MASLYDHPPVVVKRGSGGAFTDVDGNRYLDFNLADTSMFTGYGVETIVRAATERVAAGSQFLLPTEDALEAAVELGRRFGLPSWQFTLSATLANTEAIRVARAVTGRSTVLMFGLIIDETHTLVAGPGGLTARWGLEPDMLVVGQGRRERAFRSAAYGMSADVARVLEHDPSKGFAEEVATGGTLFGNSLGGGADRRRRHDHRPEDAVRPARRRRTEPATLATLLWHGRRLSEALRSGDVEIEGSRPALTRFLGLFPLPEPV